MFSCHVSSVCVFSGMERFPKGSHGSYRYVRERAQCPETYATISWGASIAQSSRKDGLRTRTLGVPLYWDGLTCVQLRQDAHEHFIRGWIGPTLQDHTGMLLAKITCRPCGVRQALPPPFITGSVGVYAAALRFHRTRPTPKFSPHRTCCWDSLAGI